MNRRNFLKILGVGLVSLTKSGCYQREITHPLEADYYLGLGEEFSSFNEAKQAGHVPYTLGIGKRINEPFDDLTLEEKDYVYDVNEATKRALEELGLQQTDKKEAVFYPIRDPYDIIPGLYVDICWIDNRVCGIEPTYPEVGYQGMTIVERSPKQIYAISKELYPSPELLGEKAFPALPWEISNTFYNEWLCEEEQRNLHNRIIFHYNEIAGTV